MNLISMWSRNANSLNLTPLERSLLKLIENALIAAFVAMLPAAAQLVSGAPINWSLTLHLALVLGVPAFMSAIVKYLKAQGDPALADAAQAVASDPALAKGDLQQFGEDMLQRLKDFVAPAGVVPPASAAPVPTAPANAVTSNASAEPAPAIAS